MPTGVQAEVKTYQMFINGEWAASKTNKTFPVYDPSTEEVIARVPEADANDVNRAVAAAKAAYCFGWQKKSVRTWRCLLHWSAVTLASRSSKPNLISTTSLLASNITAAL